MTEAFSEAAGYSRRTGVAGTDFVDVTQRSALTNLSRINSFNAAAADPFVSERPEQRQTILESLAPGLNTKVDTSGVQQHSISVNSTNAIAPRVEPNTRAVENISQQVEGKMAQISDVIREAQKQIAEVMKEQGIAPQEITEQDSSELMRAAGVALDVATAGAGSVVTAIMGAAAKAEPLDGMKGKSREQKEAIIRDALIEKQEAAERRSEFLAVSGAPSDDAVKGAKPKLDWEKTFEQHGTGVIKDILTTDPNNPNPRLFPEYAELASQKAEVDAVKENIVTADEHKYDAPNAAEIAHAANTGNSAAIEEMVPDTAKVSDVAQTLPALKGLRLVPDDIDELTEEVKNTAPALKPTPAFAGVSGPTSNGMAA